MFDLLLNSFPSFIRCRYPAYLKTLKLVIEHIASLITMRRACPH